MQGRATWDLLDARATRTPAVLQIDLARHQSDERLDEQFGPTGVADAAARHLQRRVKHVVAFEDLASTFLALELGGDRLKRPESGEVEREQRTHCALGFPGCARIPLTFAHLIPAGAEIRRVAGRHPREGRVEVLQERCLISRDQAAVALQQAPRQR